MNAPPLSWLKQVRDELKLTQKIPLWGTPPDFPWIAFSTSLQESLEIPGLNIYPQKKELSSPEDFLVSFGSNPIIKTLELSPFAGTVHLIISAESLKKITESILFPQQDDKNFIDPELQSGFFQYLLLCASESFNKCSPYPDFHIQWIETKTLPLTASFCSDLSITLNNQDFPSRMIFSPTFHQNFSNHFANNLKDIFSSPLVDSIDLPLKVEAGICHLAKKDWDRLNIGDFLILDSCSYDPFLRKGTLTLSLEKTPLFKVKIKKDKIKILDYCTYYGDKNVMEEDVGYPLLPKEKKDPEAEIDLDLDLEQEDLDSDPLEFSEETKPTPQERLASSLEIPFPIVVEIDRIFMPLKQLLSLEPGNSLELPMHPEHGVYLTVHGKKIAKGELIKLGDAIGVKIVELGESSSL